MCPGVQDDRKKNSHVHVASLLKAAIRDIEWLEKRLQKDLEIFGRICWTLFELEKVIKDLAGSSPTGWTPREARTPQGPAPTVQDFHLKSAEDGRAVATFDNTGQVTLPRTLKELIDILAADGEESPDDLVPWKSLDQLSALLEKRLGRRFAHHTIAQLLCRLRKSLGAIQQDRLIESAPALGARLRLKRRPVEEFHADSGQGGSSDVAGARVTPPQPE